MKVIRIANSIISLEDVRTVRLSRLDTGVKSNPFHSKIAVTYNSGGEEASVWIDDDALQSKGEIIMSQILTILSSED